MKIELKMDLLIFTNNSLKNRTTNVVNETFLRIFISEITRIYAICFRILLKLLLSMSAIFKSLALKFVLSIKVKIKI